MKKAAFFALSLIITACIVFMLGPQIPVPELDPTPISVTTPIDSLDGWIGRREASFKTMKPGNEAEIVWFHDSVAVTEYAVVYLHGFSASQEEGNPIHRAFAKRYGCNLYLPRLYGHGLDTTEPLINLTPENYLASAKEAIAIGKTIGKKVIVISTSTGGTLGIYLAAHDPAIVALICYSPNIDIRDRTSKVLTLPWGLPLARLVSGGNCRHYEAPEEFKKYWQTRYRLEGAAAVRSLIDHTMTAETFALVHQPIFVGAYYKNEAEQDDVVSVKAMRQMMPQLGTAEDQKWFIEFPNVGAHVMANPIRSTDVEGVQNATFRFADEVLGLSAIN